VPALAWLGWWHPEVLAGVLGGGSVVLLVGDFCGRGLIMSDLGLEPSAPHLGTALESVQRSPAVVAPLRWCRL